MRNVRAYSVRELMTKRRQRTRPRKPPYNTALMHADRRCLGWNMRALAREAGLSTATVTRVLQGQNRAEATVKRVAIALGYPVSRYVVLPPPVELAPVQQIA